MSDMPHNVPLGGFYVDCEAARYSSFIGQIGRHTRRSGRLRPSERVLNALWYFVFFFFVATFNVKC